MSRTFDVGVVGWHSHNQMFDEISADLQKAGHHITRYAHREAFLATGKPAEAVIVFQAALALEPDPNRPDLCNMMGLAEVRLGRREAAVAHFREALRLRPDFPSARANLAAALAMK